MPSKRQTNNRHGSCAGCTLLSARVCEWYLNRISAIHFIVRYAFDLLLVKRWKKWTNMPLLKIVLSSSSRAQRIAQCFLFRQTFTFRFYLYFPLQAYVIHSRVRYRVSLSPEVKQNNHCRRARTKCCSKYRRADPITIHSTTIYARAM